MTRFPTDRIVSAIKEKFGGDVEVSSETVAGLERFSFFVISPEFENLSHLKRQDALWDIVDATLSREEAFQVSSIFALAPEEVESFVK